MNDVIETQAQSLPAVAAPLLNPVSDMRLLEGEFGTIEGIITDIRFQSAANGWMVAGFKTTADTRITIVGVLSSPKVGESYQLTGEVIRDPRYGLQFSIAALLADPDDAASVEAFLASGLVKGIGAATAGKIAAQFGTGALRIIMEDPERLLEVRGVSRSKLDDIRRTTAANLHLLPVIGLRGQMINPEALSVSSCTLIWRRYGAAAVETVRANPWRLADEIKGIGFKRADGIALGLGIDQRAPERIAAGVVYVMRAAAGDGRGHIFLRRQQLIDEAQELLAASARNIGESIDEMATSGRILFSSAVDGYALPHLAAAETTVAAALRAIARFAEEPLHVGDEELRIVEQAMGLKFDASQWAAVRGSLEQRVTVITGNPGTGKTTSLRAVLDLAEQKGLRCALVSPTGRAAKRLAETVGRPAETIHRWLRYHPQQGFRGPLSLPDLLVVDEASMLESPLAAQLLTHLPPFVRLIVVGDIDQLPAVGPGNVMGDIMSWSSSRVFRLEHVFRTAVGSGIPGLCRQVIDGRRAPVFDGISSEMVEIDEAVGINKWVRDFFARYEDDTSRIQVLAPSKRGPAGTVELNNAIQAIVNPGLGGLRRNNGLIRLGDRVMQSSNYRYTNAEGEMILLANGEVGNVTELDDAHIVIDMDSGEQHDLPLSASGGLQLSYSITVHKAQGSEFPIVIVPIHGSHYLQLQRRLVYTALSRAKERVIVVGTRRALALAISKDKQLRRQTMLPALLAGAETQPPPEPATDYIDQLVDEFNDVDF